jgi:hypothetical protein
MTHKVSITKSLAIFVVSLLLACSQKESDGITNADREREYRSAHFKFHLTEFDQSGIAAIAQHLEDNFSRVANDLNAANVPIINVYFYSDRNALGRALNIPNPPSWVVGGASAADQIHVMSPHAPNLGRSLNEMLTIFVHEFAHCLTLHIAARSGNNPRWLWEGVALYEAGQFVHPNRVPYLLNGNPPTLAGLNANWQTNTQIYDVGYLLVEYIVETWGKPQLANLIRSLGDIQAILGISVAAFESGWYEFVKVKYL